MATTGLVVDVGRRKRGIPAACLRRVKVDAQFARSFLVIRKLNFWRKMKRSWELTATLLYRSEACGPLWKNKNSLLTSLRTKGILSGL